MLGGIFIILSLRRQHGMQWSTLRTGRNAIRLWVCEASKIMGLRIEVDGRTPAQTGQLYVANHVSWLDIIAIASVTECKFLSKDTVRHWPVIGWVAVSVGSLFIRRNNRRAFHQSLRRLQERLQCRESVCIFPEGTTSDGRHVLPFHSGLLQAAIDAEAIVQPVVLKYQNNEGNYEEHAPYYGMDIFLFHLLRLLSKRQTCLTLSFLPAMPQQVGADRQQLANVLQQRFVHEVETATEKMDHLLLDEG